MAIKKAKKRSKQYNKMDGALASAKRGLRNLAVFHSQRSMDGKYTCTMVNYKTAKQEKVCQSMAFAIGEVRHKWNVHLLATGKESNGKKRLEADCVPITEPLLQSDLVDYLDWRHKELAESFKARNELTNVSWLAVPNGDDISLEQIDAILTKYGAW